MTSHWLDGVVSLFQRPMRSKHQDATSDFSITDHTDRSTSRQNTSRERKCDVSSHVLLQCPSGSSALAMCATAVMPDEHMVSIRDYFFLCRNTPFRTSGGNRQPQGRKAENMLWNSPATPHPKT